MYDVKRPDMTGLLVNIYGRDAR